MRMREAIIGSLIVWALIGVSLISCLDESAPKKQPEAFPKEYCYRGVLYLIFENGASVSVDKYGNTLTCNFKG